MPERAHRGRRQDRTSKLRLSRQEREDGLLDLLGVFRVAARRSIVHAVFDGHSFAANRTLASLERRGLIDKKTVPRGKTGYQVYMLTGRGRDLTAVRSQSSPQPGSVAGPQRYWSAGGDPRNLRHDHHVLDAVTAEVADCHPRGARVVRVRLESELRGRLAAADALGRRAGGEQGARDARRKEARQLGLRVFVGAVPLPDAIIEIEESDGSRSVRAVEVGSGHYSSKQLAEKRSAGFRIYRVPGFRTDDGRRRRATLPDEEFPLSWGGR